MVDGRRPQRAEITVSKTHVERSGRSLVSRARKTLAEPRREHGSSARRTRLRLLALIEHARVVERIFRQLGLPTDRPEPRPPRAPPLQVDDPACQLGAPAKATF